MPGERRTARPRTRTRGSWLPRLAGLGAIVILAVGGTVTYLVEFQPRATSHPGPLPSRVASTQTVGLIAQPGTGSAAASIIQLLSPQHGPAFMPVGLTQAQTGQPEWIADLMTGGAYIFIYLPTSDCLASAGPAGRPKLAVERCDLSLRQRWRRIGNGVLENEHDFYQFANLASGRCIAQVGATSEQGSAAGLAACDPSHPASQLLAFWWTAG